MSFPVIPDEALLLPHWRWQAAMARQEALQPPTGDRDVRLATSYLRILRRCHSVEARKHLAATRPVIDSAYRIYTAENQVPRHALEARLLAGEAPDAIAAKSGLPLRTVQCYARLFFDVADRLASPDYVLTTVLGPRLQEGTWDYELVWKFFAYLGGAHTLDALMYGRPQGAKPTSFAQGLEFLTDHARLALQRQMGLAASAVAARDPVLARQLLLLQGRATSKAAEDPTLQQNLLERHIGALLNEIPWASGWDGAEQVAPAVAAFDEGAVELRDDELQLLSGGAELPHLEELKALNMPAPKAKTAPAAPGPVEEGPGQPRRPKRAK